MSNNKMMLPLFTLLLLSTLTRVVSADVAPDPFTRQPTILFIVLIVAVVLIAILLIKKFFSK